LQHPGIQHEKNCIYAQDNIRNPFLVSDSHLFVYNGLEGDISPLRANSLTWKSIQVNRPSAKILYPVSAQRLIFLKTGRSNMPSQAMTAGVLQLRESMASLILMWQLRDGSCLAASNWFKKIRIDFNSTQEKSVECRGGMAWFKDYLIVACRTEDDGTEVS
jgi:hypothetical protein